MVTGTPNPEFRAGPSGVPQKGKTRHPSRADVDLARISADERKWTAAFKFGEILSKTIGWVFAVYLVVHGLQEIVLSKPENIDALTKFIDKLRLGEAMLSLISVVLGGMYYRERKGKKRLIKEKARLQQIIESSDEHRSSSGLSENGDGPEVEE